MSEAPQSAPKGKAAPDSQAPRGAPKGKAPKESEAPGKAAKVKSPPLPPGRARLHDFYREAVIPRLKGELKIENVMQVPRIAKITVNMGVGEAVADKKVMDAAVADLTKITGQKPLVTKSRKAIASFKIRAGLPIGAKVTLRGRRMYEFLDRLINIAIPRIRDFRGLSPRAFDGQGNYSLGLSEQMVFPEIDPDKVTFTQGMDVTFVTTTNSDEEARELLRAFDGRGNYSLGVKEQIIFPEIQYDQIDQVRGMDITITTTARDDRKGRALLEAFNFPFRK